ncbi:MAG: response regulator, partial [Gammaproteobacteria bacterium]
QLAPEEGDVSTLVPAAEFNQVRGTVTTEALAEIARAKEALTAYLEQPADRAPLEAVPEALARVRGSLLLLEEERAARLLERLTDAVRDSLGGAQEVPGDEVLEPLAEALSAIEYYIENLRAPKVYGAEILDVAEAALDRLGLSPALQAVAAPRAPEAVDTSAPEDDAGAAEAAAGAGEAESPADHAPAEAVSETHVPGGPEAGVEPVEDLGAVPAPEPPGDSLEMEVEEIDLGVPVAEVEEVLAEPAEAAAMPEGGSGPGVPAAAPPPFEAPWPVLEDEGVDEEILEIFLEEADEEIGNIRTLLPRWLESPEDAEALTEMRRSWHTLKGSGRLVGAQLIGEFAWAFENLLNRVIDGTVTRSAAMETLLEAGLQALPQLVAQLRGEGDPELDVVAMIEDAGVLARGEAIASRDYRRAPVSQPPAPPPTEAGDAGDAAEGVEVIALPEVEAAVEEPLLEGSSSAPAEADETAATPVASKAESAMDPELCAIFQREAEGHLAVLEDHVTRARAEGQGVDEALVRALHTLHGSACMAGVDAVARIAGALEQLVKSRTPAGSRLTDEALEVMEAAIRGVREVLERLAEPGAAQPDVASLVARIEALPVVSVAGEPVGGEDAAGEEEVVLEAVDDAPVAEEVVEVPDVTGEPAIGEDAAGEEEIVLEAVDDASVAEEVVEVPGAAGEPAVGEDAAGEEEIVLEAVDDAPVAEEVVEATEVRVEDREAPGEGTPAQASESPDAPEGAAAGAREDASPADRPAQTGEAVAEEVDPELVEIFLEEGEEILARMEEVLGRWMAAPGDRALIHALQRELHTLKGGARMAGLTGIADLSHQLESFQIAVEEGRIPVTPPVFELMQLAHDRLVGMLEAAAAGRAPDAPADLLAHIEAVRKGEPAAAPAAPVPREETPASAGGTDEQAAVAAALAARADAAAQPVPSSEAPRQGTGAQPEKQEMVRVRADLLDDMVNYAGEISIYRARLEQQVGAYRFNLNELTQTVMRLREQLRQMEIETETQIVARYERETGDLAHEEFDPLEMDQYSTLQTLSRAMGESINDLISLHDQLDAITKEAETLLVQQARVNTELQEGLMRTRMVPFSGLAPRMRRIVRQACRDLGKRAELVLEGAEGEMDRTVIERIVAPLEHMLRNAVAHGIEPPAVRREKGKRETGTIRVSLHREGSEVVIRLSDDGAGMDVEAIRAKAVERGLIKPDARLGDREIIQFVLETGFSTAGEVNQVAGRGVGLDVVHNEVKQLGGTLSIDSTTGAGTTFTIRLPFTLAITQALLVRVGEELFAIPLTSIEGVVRMAQEELRGYYADPERRFEYAGYRYQVQHLGRLLGQESAPVFGKGTPRRLPVLLVRVGDQCMALQVDALLGSREAVVKSVGPQISTVRGVSGATILGDGRVVLILDMAGLLRSLEARSAQEEAFAVTAGVAEADATRVPLVMVVDDSITVRKVTRRLLERNGMQVVTAKDGVDAVAKLQDHVPDAMLLDIEMPRMDGFELATHIRNEPRLQHIPIVMITSRTGEKHRRRALEIGVDRYLGKPYQEAELLATLQELMEARAAHA